MFQYAMIAADVVAVAVLTSVLFVPRHGRRELVVAFLGVNIGVVAVTAALASGTVGAGLGLGLFGVLSIIRLRSEELAQHEVAYYFASLALGLIGGLMSTPSWLAAGLMVAILLSIYIGDHPRVVGSGRTQEVLVDRALTDVPSLTTHLEDLLGARVDNVSVRRTDLVNDTTLVRVRYSPNAAAESRSVATHERIEHHA